MTIKPQWTFTNEQGDKFFYYPALGWINSATGDSGGFDLTLARPEHATHVQIHRGNVNYVRKTPTAYCLQNERGEWVEAGSDISGLSGTVVRLCDGYLAKRGDVTAIAPHEWFKNSGHIDAMPMTMNATIYYCLRSDPQVVMGPAVASALRWNNDGLGGDVMRWCYA